jgi:hypothetical protein
MKFVGNFSRWVNPLWEHLVLTRTGQARPRDWPASTAVEANEYKRYKEAGYDLTAVNWWVYEDQDLNIDISPPWTTGQVHWWITKLLPGQYMPMHTDPDTHGKNCKRYWVPLQDYHPGHIFMYNDQVITNYKLGDVYTYIDSTDLHGAANIGHIPRIILQVTEYDS